MQITLFHHTTQKNAIGIIDGYLNDLMQQKFSGVVIENQKKNWDEHIMRFSFTVKKMFLTLEFSGTLLVTNEEAVLEAEVPAIVTTFVSEDRIREEITKKFNRLFNLN